jgi:chemotaxis protein histidine kinase CheA
MTMEYELSKLLNQDIEFNQKRLQDILAKLPVSTITPEILNEGLEAAHTLKALSAVKGVTHLEHYAAQLEQMFLKARNLPPNDVYQHVLPLLKTIEREFKSACKLLQENNNHDHSEAFQTSGKLAQLVEQLYEMDRQRSESLYEETMEKIGKESNLVSLEHLFRSYVPWVHRTAKASGKEVQVEFDVPSPIIFKSDTVTPIQTILVHLLRNALFHGIESPDVRKICDKTETGTIQLGAELHSDYILITVSDDGKGLDESRKEDTATPKIPIFFFMEESSSSDSTAVETSIYAEFNSQTGLGIGLHIVKSHVESLGGEFELKSIPFKGTSAMIRIPLHAFRVAGDD